MTAARHPLVTFLLVGLFVLDVASDISTGIELILNDHYAWGVAVLSLVLFPMAVSIIAELMRGCVYSGCCGEASTDWIPLIFYHIYTVIMMIGSGCHSRWAEECAYLRAIEGFLQAGPQLVLQLVIVFKGVLIHSLRDTMQMVLEDGVWNWEFFSGRPAVWYWGLIQVYSIVLSFASLLQTCVQFNEWPKRRHTPHKLLLVIPYFTSTIAYRASAIALLGAFVGEFAAVPLVLIALAQVVTLNSLGLDLARSVVYGFCAILAPVGYNRCRDPDNQPFGLSLLPGYAQGRCVADTGEICLPGEGDRSPDQVEALRERSKNYLAMHVILGGGILGISVAIVFLLLNFTQMFVPLSEWSVFTLPQLNDYAFPAVSFSYVAAVVLTGLFTCCIGRCFEEEYIYPV